MGGGATSWTFKYDTPSSDPVTHRKTKVYTNVAKFNFNLFSYYYYSVVLKKRRWFGGIFINNSVKIICTVSNHVRKPLYITRRITRCSNKQICMDIFVQVRGFCKKFFSVFGDRFKLTKINNFELVTYFVLWTF